MDGRWYGRGAADCKGNILMHLTALRALGDDVPVNLRLVVEGSEEQGTGGLEEFVAAPRRPVAGRRDPRLRHRQRRRRRTRGDSEPARAWPTWWSRVEALASELHSGMFGGPAPDALAALVRMLATLRDDEGNTTITGLDNTQTWKGEPYPPEQFRADAGVLDGVELLGDGTVSDMLWARPAVTVLGIDCPPVVGSAAAIQPRRRSAAESAGAAGYGSAWPPRMRWSPTSRLPRPGASRSRSSARRPVRRSAPHGRSGVRRPRRCDARAYGTPMTTLGQGGSIPLCNVFADTYPDAEIILMGVEEPQSPDPCSERERGPERDREHGPGRGALPAAVRLAERCLSLGHPP